MGSLLSRAGEIVSNQMDYGASNLNQNIIPLFFPSKENELIMIQTLKQCKKMMRVCVYTITNKNIIEAMINLAELNKKLQIQLITDDVQNKIPSQKILLEKLLASSKQIQVKLDNSPASLMHNKYLVIDDFCVVTGSFNWTNKAVTTNRENVVIINDKATTAKFNQNFEELWAIFKQYNIGDGDKDQPVHNRPYYGQKKTEKKQDNDEEKIATGKGSSKTKKEKTPRQKVELKIKKSQIIQKKRDEKRKQGKNKNSSSDDDYDPFSLVDSEIISEGSE